MQDTQEFRDIIGSGDSAEDLKNIISTYQSEIDINDAVINQAKVQLVKELLYHTLVIVFLHQ